MYAELFSGMGLNPEQAIDTVFNEQTTDPVVMRHVLFHSVCEHHLLPFFGSVNLAYVPNGKVAGLSKLARAVEVAAKRPQVQERLTMQVADAIYSALEPHVVAVEIDAEHLCMAMRGIKKPGTKVITTAVRGSFEGLDLDKRDLLASLRGMI
jgi:GTP cyclohydrolase I